MDVSETLLTDGGALSLDEAPHFHLYKAMQKLDVFSKPHAVAKAILLGLIQP